MNDTLNKKIVQVTDKSLIVGVDVGSEIHYARAILARGYEVSKKPFDFSTTMLLLITALISPLQPENA